MPDTGAAGGGVPWADLLLVALLLGFAVLGYVRGLALWLLDLAGVIAGLVIALRTFRPVGAWLGEWLPLPEGALDLAGVLLVFLAVQALVIGLGLALGYLVGQAGPPRWLRHGNRLAGIPVAAVFGAVVVGLGLAVFAHLPGGDAARQVVASSSLAGNLVGLADDVFASTREVVLGDIGPLLVTRRLAGDDAVAVQFGGQGVVAPGLEERSLALVNEERVSQGLVPLVADPALREVARGHAAEIVSTGVFSHVMPGSGDLTQRLRAAGIRVQAGGENIALAPTLPLSHQGLMDSPGHRRAILGDRYGRAGIGVIDAGLDGVVVVQVFADGGP